MSEISLSNYLQKIEGLFDDSRLTEAAAHTRHILEQYPRHINSYRLLGKILLEQHQYEDAADIFQRILSADPEDFVAHVGLSIIYKEADLLPESIWHMERAFETDPYNAAIQHELKGLYRQRDGAAPERLQLTGGALARLYVKGQLYQQAAAELRPLLDNATDRPDLEALLVETLWRDRQFIDAGQAAHDLLTRLPDCVKANAVLTDIWAANGRLDEAGQYLHRLQALTLYEANRAVEDTAVDRAFAHNLIPLPEQILVEELDYIPQAEAAGDANLDWVQALGMEEGESGGSDADNWLAAFGSLEDDPQADSSAAADPFAPANRGEGNLDWLRQVAVSGSTGDDPFAAEVDDIEFAPFFNPDEEPSATADDDFSWFEDDKSKSQPAADDDFSWVEDDKPESQPASDDDFSWLEDDEPEPQSALDEIPLDEDDSEMGFASAAMPDWMEEFLPPDEPKANEGWSSWLEAEAGEISPPQLEESSLSDDLPDWLQDEFAESSPPLSLVDPATELAEIDDDALPELPDWLDGAVDEATTGAADADDLPDWLAEPTAESADADDLPDWLAEPTAESADADALPDWLVEPTDGLSSAVSEFSDDDSEADWLAAPLAADADDLPDWLAASPDDAPSDDAPSDGGPLGKTEFDEDSEEEDWLAAQSMVTVVDDDLPDWLLESVSDDSAAETDFPADDPDDLFDGLDAADADLAQGDAIPDDVWGDEDDADADWLAAPLMASADSDDLPDWLTDIDDADFADDEDAAAPPDLLLTEEPGWPREPESMMEEEAMGMIEEPENDNKPEIPDDMDDAMAWLEQLAAEQGAPLDELPSFQSAPASSGREDDLANLPDWLQTELDDSAQAGLTAEEPTLPDWLQLDSSSDLPQDDFDTPMADWADDLETSLSDLSAMDDQPLAPAELPEWLRAPAAEHQRSLEKPSEPSKPDDLSWLDQIAAGEMETVGDEPTWAWDQSEAAALALDAAVADELAEELADEETIFELPTAVEPDEPISLAEMTLDDSDDALAWLEEMAAQQGDSLDDLPAMVSDAPLDSDAVEVDLGDLGDLDDLFAGMVAEETLSSGAIFADAGDADAPDEAGADWLDNLTAVTMDDDADELPAVESLSALEDADDAMAWLDELASEQDALFDELPSFGDADLLDSLLAESLDISDELTPYEPAEATAALSDDETIVAAFDDLLPDADQPDDEDWDAAFAAVEQFDEPDDALATAAIAEAEFDFADSAAGDDIPEDPDEMMAWLEQLAAQQGAPLDELPSIQREGASAETAAAPVEDELAWDETVDLLADFDLEADTFDLLADDFDLGMPPAAADLAAELETEPEDEFETVLEFEPEMELELASEPVAELETAVADIEDEIPDDPDEAMAWLERLAAQQGAPQDELPSVSDDAYQQARSVAATQPVEPAAEPVAEPAVDEPDWDAFAELEEIEELAALEFEPEAEIELAPEPVAELETAVADLSDEVPDDPDEMMAWMERLAAQQGAPQDELPSVSDDAYQQARTVAAARPVEPAAEPVAEPVVDEPVWDAFEEFEELEAALEAESEPELAAEPVAELETAVADLSDEVPDDPDEMMAWMERLAAQQGAPQDELPSVSDDAYQHARSVAAAQSVEPVAEPAVDEPVWDAFAEFEELEAALEAEIEPELAAEPIAELETAVADLSDEVPDDPDEMMAWMERLAAQQGAPQDELPSVSDDAYQHARTVAASRPVEPVAEPAGDEPVWDAFAEFEELEVALEAEIEPELAAEPIAELETAVADLSDEVPDDPDEMMAWMERLAAQQGAPQDELPSVSDDAYQHARSVAAARPVEVEPEPEEAAVEAAADAPDDLWRDSEEALSWLENLALEDGLALDDDFVLTSDIATDAEPEDDEEALAWLDQWADEHKPPALEAETPPLAQQVAPPLQIPEPAPEAEIEPVLETAPKPESPTAMFDLAEEGLGQELSDQAIADALPDWLSFEPGGSASDEGIDWLDSLLPDAGDWLAAEEETLHAAPVMQAEIKPVDPAPEPVKSTPAVVSAEPAPQVAATNLADARRSMGAQQLDETVAAYTNLLKEGHNIRAIIVDLETAVQEEGSPPALRRVLGDAYMRNGQLQKALDIYRQALDAL